MPEFKIVSDLRPTGDQPQAIDSLIRGIEQEYRQQTLLGVTGSGKTFTMANVIERLQRPTLVLAHNKTLAAQLYSEFKEYFPENAVEYFVSYYDYYQPEAYIPRTDTYIEKDSQVNDEIDKLRHAATRSLRSRRDVVIVASVSCIYGLGSPTDYEEQIVSLKRGLAIRRDRVIRHLIDIQYDRNDMTLVRGTFRVRGDTLEIYPVYEEIAVRVEFFGDEVERITELDPLTGEILADRTQVDVYPAKHFVTTQEKLKIAIRDIEAELDDRLNDLNAQGKILEAARLSQRTRYDIEMLQEAGYCAGVENYSMHLSRRSPGDQPWTLMDYFPSDFLLFVDESHMSLPQVRGMYAGDRSRKDVLVEHGFRLPSARDNRPLTFDEFFRHINKVVYVTATPGPFEREHSEQIVEQIIRPTGLVDPAISVRPTRGQIDDLLHEINERVRRGERTLVTTLTKKMAEDLSEYLKEMGIRTHYLHSEIETFERIEILRDLRSARHREFPTIGPGRNWSSARTHRLTFHHSIEYSARPSRVIPSSHEHNGSELVLLTPWPKRINLTFGSGVRTRDLHDIYHAKPPQLANLSCARILVRETSADELLVFSARRVGKNCNPGRNAASHEVCRLERTRAAGVERHDNDVCGRCRFVDDKRPSRSSQNRLAYGGNRDGSRGHRDY